MEQYFTEQRVIAHVDAHLTDAAMAIKRAVKQLDKRPALPAEMRERIMAKTKGLAELVQEFGDWVESEGALDDELALITPENPIA